MTDRRYLWRVLAVTAAVLTIWTGLGLRLAFLHLGPNEEMRAHVETIRHLEHRIISRRGSILDHKGNLLALDLAVKNVCVDPMLINRNGQVPLVGAYLSHILDLPPAMVLSRLNRPNRQYECIKRFVHQDTANRIARMRLRGVFLEDVTARNYPLGPTMCHVVGFANMEGVGSAGVEQTFNRHLTGHPGLRVGEKDGRRREIYTRRSLEIDPQKGADVTLTIDQHVQYLVEKALDSAMVEHSAKGGWAIVQRVRTGEILAMASRPSYDLNLFRSSTDESRLNRAISYVFEPGSTFKVGVIAAALNEGVVRPSDIIDCERGCWIYGRRPLRDYHAYDRLSVADVLKKSSNIGAAKIALKLGNRRLEKYLREFGFGRKSGIDLPGEEHGILHPMSKWTMISPTRLAMGHEVAVSALQVLNMLCAIANDGFLMRPYIVERVVGVDGMTLYQAEPEVVSRPIRKDTARLMRRLLARVTEKGGTGTRARVEGYSVGGKTGTAQKAIPGGYSDTANIASFTGFLPAEAPEIGIIVVMDEPQPLHTGGVVSGPVFQTIAEQCVRYLDIPPRTTEPATLLAAAEKP